MRGCREVSEAVARQAAALVLAGFVASACASGPAATQGADIESMRAAVAGVARKLERSLPGEGPVRVLLLPYRNEQSRSDALGEHLALALADPLTEGVAGAGRVILVAQPGTPKFKDIVRSLTDANEAIFDEQHAPKLGKLLGAEILINGVYRLTRAGVLVTTEVTLTETGATVRAVSDVPVPLPAEVKALAGRRPSYLADDSQPADPLRLELVIAGYTPQGNRYDLLNSRTPTATIGDKIAVWFRTSQATRGRIVVKGSDDRVKPAWPRSPWATPAVSDSLDQDDIAPASVWLRLPSVDHPQGNAIPLTGPAGEDTIWFVFTTGPDADRFLAPLDQGLPLVTLGDVREKRRLADEARSIRREAYVRRELRAVVSGAKAWDDVVEEVDDAIEFVPAEAGMRPPDGVASTCLRVEGTDSIVWGFTYRLEKRQRARRGEK